jgi:putative transposase
VWCQTVEALRKKHWDVGMGKLCGLFGKTRQGWYESNVRKDEEQVVDSLIFYEIKRIRKKQPNSGLLKIYEQLKPFIAQWGISMGRDKLGDFMRENGLFMRKKAYKVYTTHSFHRFYKYPNKTKGLVLNRRNQLWVTDITYVRLRDLKGEFAYLSLITDAYSRKIVGWCLWKTLSTMGSLNALNQALATLTRSDTEGLIHHSDRGIQYCSDAYVARLKDFKYGSIGISMTENGDPYENALAERMNRTIKEEMLSNRIFDTYEQAKEAIEEAIKEYNEVRPHQSINFLTPAQAHKMTGDIPKRWKRYPYKSKSESNDLDPQPTP